MNGAEAEKRPTRKKQPEKKVQQQQPEEKLNPRFHQSSNQTVP
jgi:hypothetical protein